MLNEKLFYVKQKKFDVAQKSVSCRQKQDDAAHIIILCSKKSLLFCRTARHICFLITRETNILNIHSNDSATLYEICPQSTVKTPEPSFPSELFTGNFEQISDLKCSKR